MDAILNLYRYPGHGSMLKLSVNLLGSLNFYPYYSPTAKVARVKNGSGYTNKTSDMIAVKHKGNVQASGASLTFSFSGKIRLYRKTPDKLLERNTLH